jgi:multicomponent Na+:H+ antiporter subunit D
MTILLVLPIVIPLGAAALALLSWRSPVRQRIIVLLGTVGLLAAGVALLVEVERVGVLAMTMGGWQAPFGISLVADLFSAIMVVITGVAGVSPSAITRCTRSSWWGCAARS